MAWKKAFAGGMAVGALGTILALGALGLGIVYGGFYDVAASERHAAAVRWALDTTMHRAVARGAEEIAVPASFGEEAVASGAAIYAGTCAHCHGAPGTEPAHWSRGMRPEPPEMAHVAEHMEPAEIFWIAKHGIKMSGMPAFGAEHDDEALWEVIAFVERLPAMTAEEYAALAGVGPDTTAEAPAAADAPAAEPVAEPVAEPDAAPDAGPDAVPADDRGPAPPTE